MQDDSVVRLKLVLAYTGARFKGWQIQARKRGAPERTVQGVVEEALSRIAGAPLRVYGAGRTDAGVHALGQTAHVDAPVKPHVDWAKALNGLLPKDVAVLDVEEASRDFHARFSAKSKIYTYSLWLTRRYVLPQRRAFVWPVEGLDLAAMDEAATRFVGEHDFAAFQNVGTEVSSTVRTVSYFGRAAEHPGFDAACIGGGPQELVYSIQADGFLKQMVRNIMGCLVAVGRGKLAPHQVDALLQGKDRTLAPPTAPPQGLTMARVLY